MSQLELSSSPRRVEEISPDMYIDFDDTENSDTDTDSEDPIPDLEQLAKENPFMEPPSYQESMKSEAGLPRPDRNSASRLPKPIAIPAISSKLGSPFLRAYAPCLEAYQISADLFVRFLDDLNHATVQSPPFRVLGLAGTIIGYVPLGMGVTSIVSNSMKVGARAGATAVSKGRTELLMREANRTIFGPRGLKCEIAKLAALAKVANLPILDGRGLIAKSTTLLPKVEGHAAERYMTEDGKMMIMQRRLDAFDGYIAPLILTNLPHPVKTSNPISQWNARASERDGRVAERRLAKQVRKADQKVDTEEKVAKHYDRTLAKEQRKLDRAIERDGADSTKAQKRMHKLERDREKLDSEYGERLEKAHRREQKETKLEKRLKKALWLVIRESTAEQGFQS